MREVVERQRRRLPYADQRVDHGGPSGRRAIEQPFERPAHVDRDLALTIGHKPDQTEPQHGAAPDTTFCVMRVGTGQFAEQAGQIVAMAARHSGKRRDTRQAIARDHDRQQRGIECIERKKRDKFLGEQQDVRAWLIIGWRLLDAGQ
ncbi:hypothetical protein GCM10023219_02690 [Stakelama sediminis]